MFFPEKFQKETVYAPVDYEYVHNELKKPGVTLKLLWQEHKDDPKGGVLHTALKLSASTGEIEQRRH